jgi:superfamily II DNA or RNA helicase
MAAKSSHFNSVGQIIWNRWDLSRELREIASYNVFYGTYVTSPTTLTLARNALYFARQHGIEIQPWGKLNLDLLDPEGLMEYHNARMFDLSRSDETSARLVLALKAKVSPSVMAGIQYTLLTQKCIIADPSSDDRMTIALGTIQQKECYPCLIICSREGRKQWQQKIQALLPSDVQMMDLCGFPSIVPGKVILFAEHSFLEKRFQFLSFPYKSSKGGTALIVDEAHLYKNSDAKRTQNLLAIRKGVPYRLLLTDYPVDLSYTDLRVLLRILDREADFEDLYGSLYTASRDPLVNAARDRFGFGYRHQTVLRRLHFKLRATCMLRRSDDRELDVQERVVDIPLSNCLPDGLNPEEIKHPLRMIGVKKVEGAIRWLYFFLPRCSGKTIIFAHHNDVVERVSAALQIPTYYGKTKSNRERNKIMEEFQNSEKRQVLIIANDMEFDCDFPAVSNVVCVEMPRSLSKYENILNRVLCGGSQKVIYVYFLVSENILDKRAQYRLQFREKEYDAIMDGEIRL